MYVCVYEYIYIYIYINSVVRVKFHNGFKKHIHFKNTSKYFKVLKKEPSVSIMPHQRKIHYHTYITVFFSDEM